MDKNKPLQNWLVLVIDNEYDSRVVASMLIEDMGALVMTAEDGQEALRLMETVMPNLIMCDLSMPVMDGWEFINVLTHHSIFQNVPVVALTAHAMIGDRERALQAGFRSYISKPLEPKTFPKVLLTLLGEMPEFSDLLASNG